LAGRADGWHYLFWFQSFKVNTIDTSCPRRRNNTCKNKGPNIYLQYILFWGQIMKTAKLFQNGQSQAVRLPKEFRFDDSEVFIKKTGNVVQLIPRSDSWNSLFGSLKKFSSDFMVDRVQPELDKRESF
jgi:antitoxin VapB